MPDGEASFILDSERYRIIVEVHLFLVRDDHLLMLRRFNTGYEDGNYGVIAGHMDGDESAASAMAREAMEEAGITVLPSDLRLVHVMHRRTNPERMALFFTATNWQGEPHNAEPDKCDELNWRPLAALPENTVDYVRAAITHRQNGMVYSECGWDRARRSQAQKDGPPCA